MRLRPVDLMLLTTVVLWALNLSVSRSILLRGFEPLAYSTVRYAAAAAIFAAITLALERSLRVERRELLAMTLAAVLLLLNQFCFVYAVDRATASTVGLILGSTPIWAGLIALVLGVERLGRRFWAASVVSFAGVGLVALGAQGHLGGDWLAILLALGTSATWAAYSVAIAPLMRTHSPYRISAVVLGLTWLGLLVAGLPQTRDQDFAALGWEVWALFAFAVLGPLVLTNVLWYTALDRVGPGRATLAGNLQPFVAAIFGVVLLDEHLTALQLLGGALIAAGILLAVRRRRAPTPAPPAE